MHRALNQIQWNKLRPFHGSDSGEQTKLGKQNNFAQFCKTKRSSISGVSIQKLSLCEAQFRPVPIWCKYPASPWPNWNCAKDKKRFFSSKFLFDIDTCKWTHPFLIHISLWGLLLSLTIHAWKWYWMPHSIYHLPPSLPNIP